AGARIWGQGSGTAERRISDAATADNRRRGLRLRSGRIVTSTAGYSGDAAGLRLSRGGRSSPQLVLDLADVDPRDGEQDIEVKEHVGRLAREATVARRCRDRGFDRLFAELLRGARDSGVRE